MRIADVIERFVSGFNRNDLDDVMAFFADDAVYLPGDGSEHRGRDAIRKAFLPQFCGAFGAMRFVVDDRIVDEAAGKATIRWVCQHDLTQAAPWPRRWLPDPDSLSRVFGRLLLHGPHHGVLRRVGRHGAANDSALHAPHCPPLPGLGYRKRL